MFYLKGIVVSILAITCVDVHAFWSSGVFPKKVDNQCEFSWVKKWKGFAVGHVNVLIDLKNKSGELEERAYIYLDCKGSAPKIDKAPYYDFPKMTTSCMGVRISLSDEAKLSSLAIFPIHSDSVEVSSRPGDSKLTMVWEGASTFEITNGKSFSWTMKSALSGNTHHGYVDCN